MSLNRTLKDFIVKQVKVKVLVGSSWQVPSKPEAGKKYRLEVICGNANGSISWGNEGDYNKVLLQIRVVSKGFKIGSSYKYRNNLEFYTNSSFTQKIPGSTKYRTSFELPEYKPTDADCITYLYFMFNATLPDLSFTQLQWDMGIYGAVRSHHWKVKSTSR